MTTDERRPRALSPGGIIVVGVAILIALTSAIAVVAVRSGDPATLVARARYEPKSIPPARELSCEPNEPILGNHDDFVDLLGGPTTPAAAMEQWLSLNSYGLTLDDVVAVDPGGSNAGYAEYEFQTPEATIARFPVNHVGDSWYVNDWEGCHEQIQSIIRLDDIAPE